MEGQETQNQESSVTNLWLQNNELRFVWKLVAFFGVLFFSWILLSVASYFLPPGQFSRIGWQLASLFAVLIATAFAVIGIEQRSFFDIGLRKKGMLSGSVMGTLYGFALIGCVVLLLWMIGEARVQFTGASVDVLFAALFDGLLIFVLVAAMEEILMRGYPFQIIHARFGSIAALLVTSILFSVMHVFNPHVTIISLVNIFLAGLMLGSSYLVTGSLWFPVGLHFGWNFFQGTVLGFPVSGIVGKSIFVSEPLGESIFHGGLFGVEGGIMATIMLLVGTGMLWIPGFVRILPGNPVADFMVKQKKTEQID